MRRHLRPHPLDERGLVQSVVRPCKIADRNKELVDIGVARRDPMQGRYEVEPVLEIGRAFAAGLRVSQIRERRHGPGPGDPWLNFGQEFVGQPDQACCIASAPPEQVGQYTGLPCRHAHPLAVDRIESADGIADRDQSLWEVNDRLVVPPGAFRKGEPLRAACWPGVLDRIMDGSRPQPPRRVEETREVMRRPGALMLHDANHPALSFDWQQKATAALARSVGECEDSLPVGTPSRDLEERRRVADIDADGLRARPRAAHGVERSKGERAARGCVDDEVRRHRLPRSVGALASSTGDAAAVLGCDKIEDPATVTDHDVAQCPRPSSDRVLKQRPRHRVGDPAEIAAGERVEARHLFTNIGGNTDGRRSDRGKVLIEAREDLAKRLQATGQEPMQLAGLRCARSMRWVIGEPVPFQHDYLFEMLRERTSGREAAHASPDHQGLPAQKSGHRPLSGSARTPVVLRSTRRIL